MGRRGVRMNSEQWTWSEPLDQWCWGKKKKKKDGRRLTHHLDIRIMMPGSGYPWTSEKRRHPDILTILPSYKDTRTHAHSRRGWMNGCSWWYRIDPIAASSSSGQKNGKESCLFHRLWKQQPFGSAKMKILFAESGQQQQRIFWEDEAVVCATLDGKSAHVRVVMELSSIRERGRDAGVDVYTVCETRQVGGNSIQRFSKSVPFRRRFQEICRRFREKKIIMIMTRSRTFLTSKFISRLFSPTLRKTCTSTSK